ncbi:MAG: DNA polymerase I [Candidatus Peregrinibacteria bacterium Greene1014_49]|nr:MAG: DNA polymerase I [Candidatus Peregrinibacteria bacterium Greene1014_49]
MDHLVLIDGHHLMYRAYWAIPRTLKTKAGEQSNAVFGVLSMLLSILAKEQPTHLLFCFDEGEDTFRHQEAKEYKEGRAETPDDFYVQIPRIIQGIEAFGLKHISDKRYEADDFLCAYGKAAKKDGAQVTIVTGDRDAFQVADEGIRIAIPHKGYQAAEYLGPSEIFAKYGIRPDQVAAYKGLSGDASDNLPGVKGIGPKTAAELLQKFETLAGIYEHLSEIRPAVKAKLERDRDSAFFCERMATLLSDIDLPVPIVALSLKALPVIPVIDFLKAMEFTLLERRFRAMLATNYSKQVFVPSDIAVEAPKEKGQMALF